MRDAREMAEAAARLLNEPEEEEEPPPPPPHPPPYAPASLEDSGSESSDEPPPPPPRDDQRPASARARGRTEADAPSARDAHTPKLGHRRTASGGHSRTHSDGSSKGVHSRSGSGGVLARGSAGLKEKLSSMAQSFGVRGEAIEAAEAIWAELKPHTEVPIASHARAIPAAPSLFGRSHTTFLIWQVLKESATVAAGSHLHSMFGQQLEKVLLALGDKVHRSPSYSPNHRDHV